MLTWVRVYGATLKGFICRAFRPTTTFCDSLKTRELPNNSRRYRRHLGDTMRRERITSNSPILVQRHGATKLFETDGRTDGRGVFL